MLKVRVLWVPKCKAEYAEPLGRLSMLSFKEIFESEDTLFRKKIGFTPKEDCKEDIFKELA